MRGLRRIALVAVAAGFFVVGAQARAANLYVALAEAGGFDTFLAMVEAAGLADTLKGDKPVTVFAPTNAAFKKLPDAYVDELTGADGKKQLVALINYHIVEGKLTAADLAGKAKSVKAVSGSSFWLEDKKGVVTLNGARIAKADIAADNGVAHALGTVLQPGD